MFAHLKIPKENWKKITESLNKIKPLNNRIKI